MRRTARTAADGVGEKPLVMSELGCAEMGGEKKPLVMSELGCADGCGRAMGAEKRADGCGWRSGWKWVGRRSRW